MTVACPVCGSVEFFFVQDVTQYHTIDRIEEDGFELNNLVDEFCHDDFVLRCEDCKKEFKSIDQYKESLKGGSNGKG